MLHRILIAWIFLGHQPLSAQWIVSGNRGMYVNNAGQFLGKNLHNSKSIDFFAFCKKNHISYILLMGLTGEGPSLFNTFEKEGFVNKTKADWLEDVILLAHQNGVKEIGIGYSGRTSGNRSMEELKPEFDQAVRLFHAISEYNLLKPGARVDIMSSEIEWWNLNDRENRIYDEIDSAHGTEVADHYLQSVLSTKFDLWMEPLKRINKKTGSPKIEAYIGYLSKDNINDDFQAQQMAEVFDRILTHVYTNSIEAQLRENYRSRWASFGKQPHKKIELWPLFSAQAKAIGSASDYQGYIMLNEPGLSSPQAIENRFIEDLNALFKDHYFDHGQNFNPTGFMWFNYQTLKTFYQFSPWSE